MLVVSAVSAVSALSGVSGEFVVSVVFSEFFELPASCLSIFRPTV